MSFGVTLPADWEYVKSGGYMSYLVKLHHVPCGMVTGMYYNPSSDQAQIRQVIYSDHATCGEG